MRQRWGEGIVLDKLLALCSKAPLFALAYDHPTAHRTSNMVDRLMRWQDRFLFNRQYFHRSWEAAELGVLFSDFFGKIERESDRLDRSGALLLGKIADHRIR